MLIHIHLVLIPLLLIIAAFFAASEAALFSLSAAQLEELKESRLIVYRRVRSLLLRPEALLSTFVIGNECVSIMLGTVVTSYLESSSGHSSALVGVVSILVTSTLMLLFSEVLPKVLAFRIPALVATGVVFPLSWIYSLLSPIRHVFLQVSGKVLKRLGIEAKAPSAINEEDFLTLVEVGAESGSLEQEEKDMIFNVFHVSDLSVSSIMTPWNRVFALNEKSSLMEILDAVRKRRFSRVPMVSENGEKVIGILYTKEWLRFLIQPHAPFDMQVLRDLLHPPYIVSTHKKISKLFHEFKTKKVHLALVVDEYGKHLGIVTLEDILNSLFRTPDGKGERPHA